MNMSVDFPTNFIPSDEAKEEAFRQPIQLTYPNKKISLTFSSLPLATNKAAQKHSDNHPPSLPSIKTSHPTAAVMDADAAIQKGSAVGQIAASMQQLSAPGYIDYLHAGGKLLADHPLAGLLNQTQPVGPALFGVTTGASVLGIPCTAVTLISALRDITDAKKFKQILHAYQEHYQQKLSTLEQLLESATDSNQRAILTRHHLQTAQLLATVQFIETLNHLDKKSNQFTVAGAASTIASAALTTGAQVGLVAANPSPTSFASVSLETAAGLAAASAGIASAALGVPAGIGSAGYGWYMMKKAEQQRQFFKQAYKKLMPMLKVRGIEMTHTRKLSANIEAPYLHFLNTKLRQRIVFLRWFSRFSKGLFSGGFTSGAIAIAKAIALTATVAGASAVLANPVVPILLVVLGAVGLSITAISSQQVFYRHTKHKRYYHQRMSDDPELNRAWLSTIDIWHDEQSKKGFALRAHFYQMIDKRETRRQEWLASIALRSASEQPHYFEPIQYSTDTSSLVTPIANSLPKKMAAKVRTGGLRAAAWTQSMIKSPSLRSANTASRSARNAPGTILNTEAVAAWLSDPNNRQRKIEWMRSFISDQKEFVAYKLKSREEVYQQRLAAKTQLMPDAFAKAASKLDTTAPEKLHELLQQFDTDYQKDKRFKEDLASLDVLLTQLEEQPSKRTDLHGMPSLQQLQTWFIELQHGRVWETSKSYFAAGTDDKLAHYLLKGAALRARELRGMLLETELDAASIRYKTYGTEGDLRQKQAQLFEKKLKEQALNPLKSAISNRSFSKNSFSRLAQ